MAKPAKFYYRKRRDGQWTISVRVNGETVAACPRARYKHLDGEPRHNVESWVLDNLTHPEPRPDFDKGLTTLVLEFIEHLRHHDLPHERMGFPVHDTRGHPWHLREHGFDLARQHLQPADVDDIGQASRDTHGPILADLNTIARSKPSVCGEALHAGVQVAHNLRLATNPEFPVDHASLVGRIVDAKGGTA